MYVSLILFALAAPPQDGLAAEAQARAALALAARPDPFTAKSSPAIARDDYAACYHESLRTGKHLAVWNDYRCSSSEKQMPDLIHCHLTVDKDFKAGHVTIAEPRSGELYKLAEIPAEDLCAANIRAACKGKYQRGGSGMSGGGTAVRGGG